MGFKINVDRFGFAKEPKPEKNSRDYAAELAKSLIDKESKIRSERDAELQTELDDRIAGEVDARNKAISIAVDDEVAARDNAITQEANIRSAKDAELEEAIRAEESARELLSGEVSNKVGKKGGYGLSRIAVGSMHNTLFVEVIKEDGMTDGADVQLPGTTLAAYGITNAYTKSEVDAKIAASGSVDLSDYYTKSEVESKTGYELIDSGTLTEDVNVVIPDLNGNVYKEIYCYFKVVRSADYATNAEKGRIYIANGSAQTDLLWDQQNWLTENFNDAWELTAHIKAFGEVCSTKVWFYKYYTTPYARTPVSSTLCGGEAPFKQLSKPYIDYLDVRFSSKDGTRVFPSGTTFEIWGVRA